MKVVEYKIVCQRDKSDLEVEVNGLIALGWFPLGGVNVAFGSGNWWYQQAMVRYEDAT